MKVRRRYHDWQDDPLRLEGKNAIVKIFKIFWEGS
jgi:hypothetical protein